MLAPPGVLEQREAQAETAGPIQREERSPVVEPGLRSAERPPVWALPPGGLRVEDELQVEPPGLDGELLPVWPREWDAFGEWIGLVKVLPAGSGAAPDAAGSP